jgi:hypothetical protein
MTGKASLDLALDMLTPEPKGESFKSKDCVS